MIRLKNITIKNDIIKCDILPEDSNDNGFIEVSTADKQVINYTLPLGYEWCKNHIQHAKNYLLTTYENGKKLPLEKTLIWC